jgi:hypothetical protein
MIIIHVVDFDISLIVVNLNLYSSKNINHRIYKSTSINMNDIYNFVNKHSDITDKLQLYDLINHASSDRKEIVSLKLKKGAANTSNSPYIAGGDDSNDIEMSEILVFLY